MLTVVLDGLSHVLFRPIDLEPAQAVASLPARSALRQALHHPCALVRLGVVGDEEDNANVTLLQVLAVFKIVTLLATATFFVMWMSKALRNLYAFGVPINYSPAQVGWSFFILFVYLVRPY